MIIGIDGNEANVEKKVGISEYAYKLLTQFYDLRLKVKDVSFIIYTKSSPRNELPPESEKWHYEVFGPARLWTQFALPLKLFTTGVKPDVFFSPTHYAPRFSPVPLAISIMDVSYVHFPELFAQKDLYQLKAWTSYSVKKAQMIFTISNSSKNDIIQTYHLSPEKVVVTYLGIKDSVSEKPTISMNDLKKKYPISEKYFLFVGTLQPRKNIVRVIEAFSRLYHAKKIDDDVKLIIVGKKGWLFEEILQAPEKFGVSEHVVFLDFVPNEDLEVLYAHAIAFVWPSLYEGFGLPILEAMQHGCPVITSNISSMPEAGGDAALYVNPESTEDIALKMIDLYEHKDKRERLIKKGKEQVKKFTWEKTAKETLEVLEQIGKSNN